jgi:hypothetical protein
VVFEDVALEDMQEGSDPDALSIERTGDTYEVSGVMDLTADDAELEGNPFEDQLTEAFDTAELRIAITFPGEVLETNGQVDGTTVTWEPVFGERTELQAVASASGDGAEGNEGDEGDQGDQGTEAAGGSEGDGSGGERVAVRDPRPGRRRHGRRPVPDDATTRERPSGRGDAAGRGDGSSADGNAGTTPDPGASATPAGVERAADVVRVADAE